MIKRFHQAGLDHVDLNARNILIDPHDKPWLIDLDRCRLRSPGKWQKENLARLQRSLMKFESKHEYLTILKGYI
jgi:3-deoxy-D-manno-octulosonic acid kinase